jgi:hypothetical protein
VRLLQQALHKLDYPDVASALATASVSRLWQAEGLPMMEDLAGARAHAGRVSPSWALTSTVRCMSAACMHLGPQKRGRGGRGVALRLHMEDPPLHQA